MRSVARLMRIAANTSETLLFISTTSALSKIENGKTVPKKKTIAKLCMNCAVPLARFYTLAFEASDFVRPKTVDERKADARRKARDFALSLVDEINSTE